MLCNVKKVNSQSKLDLENGLLPTATIGSGGSAGAEGPIVTIGAVVGANIAKLLGTGSQHTGHPSGLRRCSRISISF